MASGLPLTGELPPDDRCFLYGDGIFETMLAVDGRIAFARLHRERLERGARRLAMVLPDDPLDQARQGVPTTGAFVIRLTVSRGSGPRGYGSELAGPARVRLRAHPLGRDPFEPLPPLRLGRSSVTLAEQPLLAGIKHCNRLEQVLAADEARRMSVEECLQVNGSGLVQCAIAANVFALREGRLFTPPCDRSGVAGTRRSLLLKEIAPRCELPCTESPLSLDDIRDAEGLVLTSAIYGVRLVSQFEERCFAMNARLQQLQSVYFDQLRQCLAI